MKNLSRNVRTIHDKAMSFPCAECDYSTSRHDDLKKHMKKRHNNAPPFHNVPPKFAHHNPNIIEPNKNDQFQLTDIEQQELSDMLNNQTDTHE